MVALEFSNSLKIKEIRVRQKTSVGKDQKEGSHLRQ